MTPAPSSLHHRSPHSLYIQCVIGFRFRLAKKRRPDRGGGGGAFQLKRLWYGRNCLLISQKEISRTGVTRQRDGRLAPEISAAVWSLPTTQLNGQRRGAGHIVETSVACLAWMSYRMISLRYVRHLCSPVLHTDTSPCCACCGILAAVSGVNNFRLKSRLSIQRRCDSAAAIQKRVKVRSVDDVLPCCWIRKWSSVFLSILLLVA